MAMSKTQKTQQMPPWLQMLCKRCKTLLIPVLCLIMLLVGLMLGYVYLGGKNVSEVFELSTWKHLFDLIFADT